MSAVLVVKLVFTNCLTESEVLFVFVCCYDIEFESNFIVILHCFMYSTVVNICCINMCFINKVNIEQRNGHGQLEQSGRLCV